MSFIIELEPALWIAEFEGDPGRTLVEANAQEFDSHEDALTALDEARKYRPFKDAAVIDISPSPDWAKIKEDLDSDQADSYLS